MQLQQVIDAAKLFSEVRFEGEINLELSKSTSFYVGKNFTKSLVTITKPNITLDFSNAIVRVNIMDSLDTDLNIFFVSSMAKNVECFKHGKKRRDKESEIACLSEYPRNQPTNRRNI